MNQLNNETEQRIKQLNKDHFAKKEKLQKELTRLNEEFTKIQAEHAAEETKLKQKKLTAQNGLEDNIKTYDTTIEQLNDDKNELEVKKKKKLKFVGLFFV